MSFVSKTHAIPPPSLHTYNPNTGTASHNSFTFATEESNMLVRARGPDGTVRITVEPADTFARFGEKVRLQSY